jgi:hypothetical protein
VDHPEHQRYQHAAAEQVAGDHRHEVAHHVTAVERCAEQHRKREEVHVGD